MRLYIPKLTLLLCLLFSSLIHAADADQLYLYKWSLVILQNVPINLEKFPEQKPFLKLEADNVFTAYAGCKELSGSFQRTDPNGITFLFTPDSIATSETVCPDEFIQLENSFINMMRNVVTWEIIDNTLNFTSNHGNTSAILTSVEPY